MKTLEKQSNEFVDSFVCMCNESIHLTHTQHHLLEIWCDFFSHNCHMTFDICPLLSVLSQLWTIRKRRKIFRCKMFCYNWFCNTWNECEKNVIIDWFAFILMLQPLNVCVQGFCVNWMQMNWTAYFLRIYYQLNRKNNNNETHNRIAKCMKFDWD